MIQKYYYSKNNHCKCGKKISNKAKQCNSCSKKGKNNPAYKKGRTLEIYYCKDCKKKISYNSKRCHSCETKRKYKLGILHYHKIHHCIENCRTVISHTSWKYGNRRCRSCSRKLLSGINAPMYGIRGKIHPSWLGGISKFPYAFEFNNELKEKIRQRDNHQCQNCSMTEEEHIIVIGRVLPIHHIDYNKQNSKEENLITLCNQCNARANTNRDYWKEFYQEKINILLKKVAR